MRCGWSFVVLDSNGVDAAAGAGAPPPWITEIGGAEAWAMFQAASRAFPGLCTFRCDCVPCIQMIKAGLASGTSAKRVLPRVYAMVIPALEDTDHAQSLWMPAHKSTTHVGVLALSNGALPTAADVKGNDGVGIHAKAAVEEHRVSRAEVQERGTGSKVAKERDKWLARVTTLPCSVPNYPFSDSEATIWRSDEAKRQKLGQPSLLKRGRPVVLAQSDMGYKPVKTPQIGGARSGCRCTTCRDLASTKEKLTRRRCRGRARWETQPAAARLDTPEQGDGHTRVYSGDVVWCSTCGAYAGSKANGMGAQRRGAPVKGPS